MPSNPRDRATFTISTGSSLESGEYREWEWRSRRTAAGTNGAHLRLGGAQRFWRRAGCRLDVPRAARPSPGGGHRARTVRGRARGRGNSPSKPRSPRSARHGAGQEGHRPLVRTLVVSGRAAQPRGAFARRCRARDGGGGRALARGPRTPGLPRGPSPREPARDARRSVRVRMGPQGCAHAGPGGRLRAVDSASRAPAVARDDDDQDPRAGAADARVRPPPVGDLGIHVPAPRGPVDPRGLADRSTVGDSLVHADRLPSDIERNAFRPGSEEEHSPALVDEQLELPEVIEGDARGTTFPQDLRAEGRVLWRQHEADHVAILAREEHAVRLHAPELRGLEVREERDLASVQLVPRVVLADPRDDLAALVSEVDLHDVQLVRVRMVRDVQNLGDTDIQAVRLSGGRFFLQIDLREERFPDAQRLSRGDVLESGVPRLAVDVVIVPEGMPRALGGEREERGHDHRQRTGDPEGHVKHGAARLPVRPNEVPRGLRIKVLVPEPRKLDRLA